MAKKKVMLIPLDNCDEIIVYVETESEAPKHTICRQDKGRDYWTMYDITYRGTVESFNGTLERCYQKLMEKYKE